MYVVFQEGVEYLEIQYKTCNLGVGGVIPLSVRNYFKGDFIQI